MKLHFIANACCIYESNGKKLLCDPWLTEGAFYGSWFHYPPLDTRPQDISEVDYLYISHLHPDHMDPNSLKVFRRDIPIICLDDDGPNYLKKILTAMGFTNLHMMQHGSYECFGPFLVTMFKPFVSHPFYQSELGNLVDSAILVEADGQRILNTNDNMPSPEAAIILRKDFGKLDVAQLNYNAAGPYPACFDNMSVYEKVRSHELVLSRNIEHMQLLVDILEPEYVMPFAGAYVIGGRNYELNNYLGTMTQDECAARLENCTALLLDEYNFIDLDTKKLRWPYEPIDKDKMAEYIVELKDKPYSYDLIENDYSFIESKLIKARANLWKMQKHFNFFKDYMVYIDLGETPLFWFNFEHPSCGMVSGIRSKQYLNARLPISLLNEILERRCHWNNAEIGCHIKFNRHPDIYDPDIHTLMSFFHL